MTTQFTKYIIIGAGLSGWVAAYYLQKQGETDIAILESRDRLGGRIYTKNDIDLGATWIQPYHKHIQQLLDELEIKKSPQYTKGTSLLVHKPSQAAHPFESDQNAPSLYRIAGGSKAIIDRLAQECKVTLHLNTLVTAITEKEDLLIVTTPKGNFEASHVISTVPPRIALGLKYSPPLPSSITEVMDATHTWMSNAIKVGITYEQPFWIAKKLSGTIIGQRAPVTELYDHSDFDNETYALMGFINEGMRGFTAASQKAGIIDFILIYLGTESRDYLNYQEKDWSQDPHTTEKELCPLYMRPQYGDAAFASAFYNNKLLFSGAETSPVYGGYMEGAVYSGIKAATFFNNKNLGS